MLLGKPVPCLASLHVGVHVDHVDVEARPQIRNQDESRVPVWVGQDLAEPGVEDARAALVGCEDHDGFCWPNVSAEPLENYLCDPGACAAVVAGGSSFVKVLSPGVEAFILGNLGGCLERIPREVEDV